MTVRVKIARSEVLARISTRIADLEKELAGIPARQKADKQADLEAARESAIEYAMRLRAAADELDVKKIAKMDRKTLSALLRSVRGTPYPRSTTSDAEYEKNNPADIASLGSNELWNARNYGSPSTKRSIQILEEIKQAKADHALVSISSSDTLSLSTTSGLNQYFS